MINTELDLGRVAYVAYCKELKWKSFNGDPLPRRPDVNPDIQEGWRKPVAVVLLAWSAHSSEYDPIMSE